MGTLEYPLVKQASIDLLNPSIHAGDYTPLISAQVAQSQGWSQLTNSQMLGGGKGKITLGEGAGV